MDYYDFKHNKNCGNITEEQKALYHLRQLSPFIKVESLDDFENKLLEHAAYYRNMYDKTIQYLNTVQKVKLSV